jgi:putative transposase
MISSPVHQAACELSRVSSPVRRVNIIFCGVNRCCIWRQFVTRLGSLPAGRDDGWFTPEPCYEPAKLDRSGKSFPGWDERTTIEATQFSNAQNAFILEQCQDGVPVAEICCKAGISQATSFNWKKESTTF